MPRKYVFPITPQSHVRSTQGDRWYFRIPREKLRPPGLRRLLRLEKYNKYKLDISSLAKAQGFTFPSIGACVKFYIPVPKTWRKWKKEQHHLQYHTSKFDLDNLMKALLDSLMAEDKHIAHFEAAKFWTNSEQGWIEITDKQISDALV